MMEENDGEKTTLVLNPRQKNDEADRKKIEKGYKAKTLLVGSHLVSLQRKFGTF